MSDVKDITLLDNERESGLLSLKNQIPPNIRMFVADIFGMKDDFTEENLSAQDQKLLKEIAMGQVDKGYLDYGDYGVASIDRPLLRNLMDDRYNLKTLLGKAKVEVDEDGNLIVKDTFDFNDAKDISNLEDLKDALSDIYGAYKGETGSAGVGGLYSAIRQIGKYIGSAPGEGAEVNINLGSIDKDI